MASAGSSDASSGSRQTTLDGRDHERPNQVPRYGNYRGYYSIRREGGHNDGSDDRDTRIKSIFDWLNARKDTKVMKRVLDIGCNDGQFTLQLCEALEGRSEYMYAVDIDRELVLLAGSSARKLNKFTTRQESVKVLGSGRKGMGSSQSRPRKRLRLEEEQVIEPLIVQFLQSNWVYNDEMARKSSNLVCPQDMMRMQWNDMRQVSKQDEENYNLIFAMSVTKWIHIIHYDTGLRRFFARVATCLAPNGIFIMEPQAYKSYKHTLKVTPADSQPRKNFYALRVMPDDFAWILTEELGLEGPYCIREKGKDASVRQIDAFIQPPTDRISRHCLDRRSALLAMTERVDPLAQIDDYIPWVPRNRQ